ncbi:hypothetical protein IT774_03265 [Salinimonas marina]|uniref:Uncharacterized protein n=1 Tax=Salinimonas marina TaxID=2785918 RepID=A0A7S9HE38_9ALTE|nr:hypothetical protein [Salinimonas marina]QPG06241.1 hypothetical protein IT774_03265 [Salinimonas marina]
MATRTLKLDIQEGNWMVNVIDDNNDDGKYELLHPNKEAEVEVDENKMQALEYNIVASAGTRFKITLDDTVLAEGEVGDTGIANGRGVI